ncbi:hypothetical protein [Leptospira noguchii]|uniref:Uncharacterized protein n=1 Tax=Leptospira noguchii TaxID=28182 RepID=A0AAE9GFY3_9LEPT|nr:hypothetical protein [Leptospira noguchii]UOG32323.1 hypothetical protein MAL06_13195 [Leptospira noguchii]UOG53596.1 hypothetical protein MAL09_05475 [Leptospira noguchii]UOG55748.1 hypothetical protein MAL03_12775 [Leptospira noguchii]
MTWTSRANSMRSLLSEISVGCYFLKHRFTILSKSRRGRCIRLLVAVLDPKFVLPSSLRI